MCKSCLMLWLMFQISYTNLASSTEIWRYNIMKCVSVKNFYVFLASVTCYILVPCFCQYSIGHKLLVSNLCPVCLFCLMLLRPSAVHIFDPRCLYQMFFGCPLLLQCSCTDIIVAVCCAIFGNAVITSQCVFKSISFHSSLQFSKVVCE